MKRRRLFIGSACPDGMAAATERTVLIEVAPGTTYVDASAALGRANQRLYRQGMAYDLAVSYQGNAPAASGTRAQIEITSLPNTWAIRNAHKLAKKMWNESSKEERAAGIKRGRWNDFRVFMDASHTAANNVNTPFGSAGLGSGEINFTQAARADTGALLEYQFLGSTSATRFGMLAEYDLSQDTDTDTPAGGSALVPYRNLIGEIQSAQGDQIQEEGDNPPYDPVVMQNNIVFPGYFLQHPAVGNQFRTPTMTVVAGLIGVVNRADTPQFIGLHFKAGQYKGVAAEVI